MKIEDRQDHYALLIDVCDSRSYSDTARECLQVLLDTATRNLNEVYARWIDKPVMFSAGDELQGLFSTPSAAFLYYRYLSLLLGAGTIRGSIGAGAWKIRMSTDRSTDQDGPAYHRARAGINWSKESSIYDFFYIDGSDSEQLTTTIMNHSLDICAMRTDRQAAVALAVELLRPLPKWQFNELLPDLDITALLNGLFEFHRAKGSPDDFLVRFCDGLPMMDEKELWLGVFGDCYYDKGLKKRDNLQNVTALLETCTGLRQQGLRKLMERAQVRQERCAVTASVEYLEQLIRA